MKISLIKLLLPDQKGLKLLSAKIEVKTLKLELVTTTPKTVCPNCVLFSNLTVVL
jgi:hypothetical protein